MALVARHVREAARVLRTGGVLLIFNVSYRGDPHADRAELDALAAPAGLRLERAGERPCRLWDAPLFQLRKL